MGEIQSFVWVGLKMGNFLFQSMKTCVQLGLRALQIATVSNSQGQDGPFPLHSSQVLHCGPSHWQNQQVAWVFPGKHTFLSAISDSAWHAYLTKIAEMGKTTSNCVSGIWKSEGAWKLDSCWLRWWFQWLIIYSKFWFF